MLRFLLDTDTAIELMRHRAPQLVARCEQHTDELAFTSVSASELWFGAERSSDPTRNRHAVNEFLSLISLVDSDLESASHAAEIRAELARTGTPIGAYDLQIAAVARTRGLTVITGNQREFSRVPGLRTVDWIRSDD